eukprot:TRINITY_DN1316_c0_g1_i2.p1 TRINITY_DN1316_c0_g1~~TRINITY_DN1316_c0_g1_i2.p1  ORF type:complete len:129 (-),score=18.99 TRINITY_DN1316_c0_g1_i2:174-560(-)
MIKDLRLKYPNKTFGVIDAVSKPPYKSFDLIFSRDMLSHLTNKEIWDVLRNWKNSGSTYLLTSIYVEEVSLEDVDLGGWRQVNLMAKPFELPDPLEYVEDQGDKKLALWKLKDSAFISAIDKYTGYAE